MAHYGQCLLNNGKYAHKLLLDPRSIEKLFTPQISTPYGRGDDPQYCLGWCKSSKTGQIPYEVIAHGSD